MNELALFAGGGGGILASLILGWSTVAAVEIEQYPREVLLQRQRDGLLEPFPIWDDVRTFDGRPWRGLVDVVSGGFPCQDISVAGTGRGISGERSGLWVEYLRIVEEIRPRFVFAENSPALRKRGLGRILQDLAELGYDARWGVLGAGDIGAPHMRKRIWILAYPNGQGQPQPEGREQVIGGRVIDCGEKSDAPNADGSGCEKQRIRIADATTHETTQRGSWWTTEPELGRLAHGVANRVDQLRALGNGQVPAVAAAAFTALSEGLI